MVEQSEIPAMGNDELLTNYWNWKNALPQIQALGRDTTRVQGLIDACLTEMAIRNLIEASPYEDHFMKDGSPVMWTVECIPELN